MPPRRFGRLPPPGLEGEERKRDKREGRIRFEGLGLIMGLMGCIELGLSFLGQAKFLLNFLFFGSWAAHIYWALKFYSYFFLLM